MDGVRRAQADDLPAVLDLADARRAHYETFQPRFWRVATGARAHQEPYLRGQLEREDHISLVHERDGAIDGFIVGRLLEPPPVYDPGGIVCAIDDFAVAQDAGWDTAGAVLLGELNRQAHQRGAVLSIVVSGHLDESKRSMPRKAGFSIASEWWVREI